MECVVMADLAKHEYEQEKFDARWDQYEASLAYEQDVIEQIDKLITDPDWFWEGTGPDGFAKFKLGADHLTEPKLMQAFTDHDFEAVGKHFVRQLEAYVYDQALNNLPGPP